MNDQPRAVDTVPLAEVAAGDTQRFWLRVSHDEIGDWHRVPLIIRRGLAHGPIITLTAVVHGNELNGMRTIVELLADDACAELACGTIVAVPVVNLPGYRRHERAFADGKDLNRFVTAEKDGRPAQRFGHALAVKLLEHSDCLLDLHTAGGGRRNIFYARVDLDDDASSQIARDIAPPVIAHKPARDTALRGFAAQRGIAAVVLEIGDPGRFQPALVSQARAGILRVLDRRGMLSTRQPPGPASIVCRDAYWVRARQGGAAYLSVRLGDQVAADQLVGVVRDVWGRQREELRSRRAGMVIGMLRRPVVMEGSPILHIGVEHA